jgi:uncharacterized damage-inducible protein DinB
MTLGGLLKHLAYIEADWFSRWLHGETGSPRGTRWTGRPIPTGNGTRPPKTPPEQLFALWQDAVDRSRSLITEALADGGLERLAERTWPSGEAPSLRWILVHMIEEYARHNGHADLIRESVDGQTGE